MFFLGLPLVLDYFLTGGLANLASVTGVQLTDATMKVPRVQTSAMTESKLIIARAYAGVVLSPGRAELSKPGVAGTNCTACTK